MNIKYILATILTFMIIPVGFSPGTLTDEDAQWIENFDEMFEQNPLEGFSRNIEKAWEFLQNSPQRLAEFGRDVISRAFQTSSDNFVDLVDSERSLLEDPDVREFYERAVAQNPSIANNNPETFNRFLQEEGIGSPGSSLNFELASYNQATGIMTMRRDDGSVVSISKTALQGGTLNSDGSVILRTGQQILDGTVVETSNNEFRVAISSSSRSARVINQGVEFTGTEMSIGIDSSTQNQFVRAVSDDISFQDFFGRDVYLTQDSRLSINEEGDYGLRGRLEIRSMKDIDTIDGLPSLDAAYETDFIDQNEEMVISFRPDCCEGLSNYIIEQTSVDGGTIMEVSVNGQRNPKIEVPQSRNVDMRVNLIEDETRLSIIQRGQEAGLRRYEITNDKTVMSGFGSSSEDRFTLRTTHIQFSPYGDEIIDFLFNAQNPQGIRSNQVVLTQGIGDLSAFPEEIRELLQNTDFQSIPLGEISIVNALSRLGLPTDMSFRRQIAEQLGIEGYRGTRQQNEQMIAMLREGEFNTGVSFYLAGEEFPEIFEFDPNFQGIVAQLQENAQGELELPPSLQDFDKFGNINFRDPSIVNILNQMGLDSSFAARQQLYRELFGREPPTGDRGAQMNMDLRRALGELHAEGVISTRGGASGQVSEPLTQQQIAQGQRMTPRGQNFDGNVVIRNLPAGLRSLHPNGMTVDEAAARTLFGECRGCSDTEMRLLADVIRNRAYRHNGDFSRVIFSRWQFSPWNGFTVPSQSPDTNGRLSATTNLNDPQMQRAMRIWQESARGDTSNGATHFFNPRTSSPNWGSSLISTVPQGVSTQHRIGYLSSGDPFRPAVVRARNE